MSAPPPLRIVMLEDSPEDAFLMERALRRANVHCEIVRVDREDAYKAALEAKVDAVLSDYSVPGFSGLRALALLREHHPDVPFILVSGTIGEELAVEAMKLGATDYLLKDRLSRLAPALLQAHEQAQLHRQKRALEEQLLRAQRIESIGRLASGVAHDLNNLLMPILVAQDLLAQRIDDPASRQLLGIIETNAQRGAEIVTKLLAFGRGATSPRNPQRLAPVVAEMSAIMRETFPKNIALRERITEEGARGWVQGDPTQLHQVLMNLCVNARDAMPSGGTLTVSLDVRELDAEAIRGHPGAREGRHVELRVADTGSGIPSEHLRQIFEPFFTTKDATGGTGLGLPMVLGIAERHGGFVRVETGPAGTTFVVLLPAVSESPAVAAPKPHRAGARGSGEVVLVVDDEPAIRHVLREALEQAGYQVLEAEHGERGLELCEEPDAAVQLVVTDLAMPHMDGLTLVRRLRERGKRLPVLVITAASTAVDQADLRALQVCAVMEKPVRLQSVVDAVRCGLRGSQDVSERS